MMTPVRTLASQVPTAALVPAAGSATRRSHTTLVSPAGTGRGPVPSPHAPRPFQQPAGVLGLLTGARDLLIRRAPEGDAQPAGPAVPGAGHGAVRPPHFPGLRGERQGEEAHA